MKGRRELRLVRGAFAIVFIIIAIWIFRGRFAAWKLERKGVSSLLAETSFNAGAINRHHLFIHANLFGTRQVLMLVDTGSPHTVLDTSLIPILGPRKKTTSVEYIDLGRRPVGVYAAPPLSIGSMALKSHGTVYTDNLRSIFSEAPIDGILGVDYLGDYCFELSFTNLQMRFYDMVNISAASEATILPLSIRGGHSVTTLDFPAAGPKGLIVDTGLNIIDMRLSSKLFAALNISTNGRNGNSGTIGLTGSVAGRELRGMSAERYYPAHALSSLFEPSGDLGLHFLSRYPSVTFAFPQRKLVLSNISNEATEHGGLSSQLGVPAVPGAGFEQGVHLAWTNRFPYFFGWNPAPGAGDSVSYVRVPAGSYEYSFSSRPDTSQSDMVHLDLLPSKWHTVTNRGSCLLLLHDLGETKESCAPWAYDLALVGYDVYCLDLPGHGDSPSTAFTHDAAMSNIVEMISIIHKQAYDERIGIIGFGYGANLALEIPERDPGIGPVVAVGPVLSRDDALWKQVLSRIIPSNDQSQPGAVNLSEAFPLTVETDLAKQVNQHRSPVMLIQAGEGKPDSTKNDDSSPFLTRITMAGANRTQLRFYLEGVMPPMEQWLSRFLTNAPNLKQ